MLARLQTKYLLITIAALAYQATIEERNPTNPPAFTVLGDCLFRREKISHKRFMNLEHVTHTLDFLL
jgi:hypothetical protein